MDTTLFSHYPFKTSDGVVSKEINLGAHVYLVSPSWFFSKIFPPVVCSSHTGGDLQFLAARHDSKSFHFHSQLVILIFFVSFEFHNPAFSKEINMPGRRCHS